VSDLIQEEKSGYIIEDPRDTALFAERLKELAENSEKRENMGKSAREKALDCSWDRIAEKTRSVYEEII
jgi:glycosyltransferase involved in cell wall biosynthesis